MHPESLKDKTDEQLMKLYQSGDDLAFKVLYERHSAKIYGFLSKRIGNKEKVAEIYQEVFIKIHKSKSLYDEELPLLPWIFTVTKTVMLDQLRKDKNIKTVQAEFLENMATTDNQSNSGPDIVSLLAELPEVQRKAVEMRYVKDNSFEQIAESLNIKPSNARQIISRGIKRLRELMGKGGSHE